MLSIWIWIRTFKKPWGCIVFHAASLVCLISSRFPRLHSLPLAGDWGIVLHEGLVGQEQCSVHVGRDVLKKILQRQRRAGKEAKSFIFVTFEDKVSAAEVWASFPKTSILKETKGRERISAMSRWNCGAWDWALYYMRHICPRKGLRGLQTALHGSSSTWWSQHAPKQVLGCTALMSRHQLGPSLGKLTWGFTCSHTPLLPGWEVVRKLSASPWVEHHNTVNVIKCNVIKTFAFQRCWLLTAALDNFLYWTWTGLNHKWFSDGRDESNITMH